MPGGPNGPGIVPLGGPCPLFAALNKRRSKLRQRKLHYSLHALSAHT
jgi:hypothetical protein